MLKLAEEGVIYARVSSARQVREGRGLQSQVSACQRYAKENDIKIVEVFEDPAQSGKDLNRPGMINLLSFLSKRKNLTYVLVEDISRLSRNVREYYALKDLIQSKKGLLKDLKNQIGDVEDPNSELTEGVIALVAQQNRIVNRLEVISKQKENLLSGRWVYPAPVGYVFKDKHLVVNQERAKLIKKIFKDFASGKYTTYKQIKDSKEANLLINPKSGTRYRFKDDTIRKLLTNKLYMGKIELKKWGIAEQKAIHEAIIDESTFRKVQIMLEKKGKKKHSNISPEEFPLKGDLICSQCKSTLVYSKSTGRPKKYPYYRCNTSRENCDISPKSIQTEVIHKQFSKLLEETAIKPQVLKLADKVLEDVYKTKSDQLMGVQQTQEATIRNLTKKRDEFIKKLIHCENVNVEKALEKEINKIDIEINELGTLKADRDDLKGFKLHGIKMLEKPQECWLKANYQERKLIYDFIFDKPLEIRDGQIGTAPYALPYRLLANRVIKKDGMVELAGFEPATFCVPRRRAPNCAIAPNLINLNDLVIIQLS